MASIIKSQKIDPNSMTLMDHLRELRSRLVKAALAFFVCAVFAYIFYSPILKFLERPLCQVEHQCKLIALSPLDLFTIRLKVSAYVGIIASCPVWTYQIWRFVSPGLTQRERKLTLPLVVFAFILFLLGALIAYLSYPHTLGFFKAVGTSSIKPVFTATNYFNLLLALLIVFGLTFEFPIVLVGLELAEVLKPSQLRKYRRYSVLGLLVLSGVITPSSDPFSMFAMFIPLWIFYELSILIGIIYQKRKNKKSATTQATDTG